MLLKDDLTNKINRLAKIGIALSAEKNINNFFKLILNEAINFTNSDAGTIYWVSDDKKFLEFQFVCTLSKNQNLENADVAKWPNIPLYDENDKKLMKTFVSYVTHTAKPKSIDNVYSQDIFSDTKKYDSANDYRSVSMAAIPLKNHEDDVLGIIQLINAMDDDGNIIPFSQDSITVFSSLASQAAIAMTNKTLVDGLENLLKQFMKSIAYALDKKSKDTGSHIERVAILTEMLANKIQIDNKKYKDFHFSQNELQEISIAGWMHDIGKITTPVYIMHKAKKLETIYDRIGLVKLRFELVESVIEKDNILYEYNGKKDEIEKANKILKKLKKYSEFIKQTNSGSEFMTDEDIELLDAIYNFEYTSNEKTYRLITEDEKKNLSIHTGTLLPEEFEKMREHALVSHEMLTQLTFPKKFKNVTLYASGHHEKLNGTGYPFGICDKDLPLQSRMLAITDFFEALTATDRPYKKGKTLSESLQIMAISAKDNEIDKDLLNLFIDSGLYLEYAEKFLKKEQINDFDINKVKNIYN
ncbi:MAG: GAF domain-containing protein [Candidatus Cloacimonetes bacterium]|nr:GAF domain-containing protein [Candidatus Cloacimonadota bacterium]